MHTVGVDIKKIWEQETHCEWTHRSELFSGNPLSLSHDHSWLKVGMFSLKQFNIMVPGSTCDHSLFCGMKTQLCNEMNTCRLCNSICWIFLWILLLVMAVNSWLCFPFTGLWGWILEYSAECRYIWFSLFLFWGNVNSYMKLNEICSWRAANYYFQYEWIYWFGFDYMIIAFRNELQ